MSNARSALTCASLAVLGLAAACDRVGTDGDHYLSPSLRAAVDGLKSDVAATPTDASTIAARALILADWADAYAMAGGEVGLDETPVPLDAPRGWRHWRGTLTVEGADLDAIEATDFINPGTQFLEHEGNTARFATHTRGDWSSVRMSLSNVRQSAQIVLDLEEARETGSAPPFVRSPVTIPGQTVRLRLSDMRRGRLERALPAEGYENDGVTLRQIIRDGPRDVEFVYTDEREPQEGDYYYVRVRQVNDAMAWSSPIWVGGYSSR